MIEYQVKGLEKDAENAFHFFSYFWAVTSISIVIYAFKLGGTYVYIWYILNLILAFQYAMEYHFFLLTILEKTENMPLEKVLDEYEEKKLYAKTFYEFIYPSKLFLIGSIDPFVASILLWIAIKYA
jgi:hypothetical protein